jgi:hypothetical protein
MSKNLHYYTVLIGGGVMITLGYVWSTLPYTKQDTDRAISHTTTQAIATLNDVYLDKLKEQLNNLQQQFATEQVVLHEQINTLQDALEALVEKSETEQNEASPSIDPLLDTISSSHEDHITAQELSRRIAKADFSQQEAIASQLNAEEVDPHWSGWAEAEIRAAIETDVSLNTQLLNVVCRSTFCRVEAAFGDSDTRGQFISKLMALVPWEAQAFYHGDESEGVTGALYIMKEGATEPENIQKHQ